MLRECGVKAEQEGWIVIPIASEDRTATIVAAAAKGKGKLLLLVDNADRNDADLMAALRVLVTDAAKRSLLVVSAGEQAVGLPGAEAIVLQRFSSRDLKRFVEPLLLRALNPEDVLREVERSAAGNPLWVELILASWLESGRLRLVHGRPFLDDRIDAPVPKTVAETVSFIVQGLSPGERDLVEAMAVWAAPLPAETAGRVLSSGAEVPHAEVPQALVSTEGGRYRFIGETVGWVILGSMAPARKQHWSAVFLSVLAEDELHGGQRASLLLGAGRTAEGIRALVAEGREAEERHSYAAAFRHFRDALAHHPKEPVPGVDRVRLTLDGARLATLVGELRWAREVLESMGPMDPGEPDRDFERTFLQANVLRELRHAGEAAENYAEARALISRNPSLRERLVEVELAEAANDAERGEGERALRGVEAIVKRLAPKGTSRELGLALQCLALLHAHLGHTRASAVVELRCARVARRFGDRQLAARAFVNLGRFYRLLQKPRRALMALDSAQAELAHCPHDGIAASVLVNRSEILIDIGRIDEAEAALLRGKALRQRSGERGRLPVILIDLGALCRSSGRLAAAAAYLREAISLAEEFELPAARIAQSNLGEIFLHQGEYEEAGRLLRLGLADRRPHFRGITLINLGRLHREQMRLREALQILDEAETLLRDSAPRYRPLAVLERGRVLLDAGDVDGAMLQLLQVESEVGERGEQQAEYGLLAGLITAARGEAPQQAFDAAIDAVRGSKDPTLRGEVLIAVLERAIPLPAIDRDWIAGHFQLLEAAAAMTDARPVAIGLRLIRGAFAERFPSSPAPGVQTDTRHLQLNLERGGSALESALGELMHELPGAAGAAVFVVGIDADGKPLVSSIPRAKAPADSSRDGRVRPYRLAVREFDRRVFREALAAASGNVHEAARQLRLPTSTFRYRAMKLGLLKPTQRDH
jgi:tetratricopeptide (TPR) repeat protein